METYTLTRESELRIEVGDNPIRLQLSSGQAEIFGTELPPQYWLTFPPAHKLAIFTWNGATVEVEGKAEVSYVADETPMVSYVNIHAVLDRRRAHAKEAASTNSSDIQGPRVIVVGPSDSGKSSLSKMLLSWAARLGWKPTFVDLDIGQGAISIPGTIAATLIEMPIDPVEGIPLDVPLVYYFGHTNPSINPGVYKALVKELAKSLEMQFSGNVDTRAAGMVINTMGWVEGVGYELLIHAIYTFNVDVVLVLGQEKLYSMLKDVLKGKQNVDVVKLHKSGGVVSRNQKYRSNCRVCRIRAYFYGLNNDLAPHATVSNFSDIQIFRIGGGPQAPRSALPIGAEPVADPTRVVPIAISTDLTHAVLGVSHAKDPDQLMTSNIAGFVYITEVDIMRKKISYIVPCPGELPSRFFLAGSITWLDS